MNGAAAALWMAHPEAQQLAECSECRCVVPAAAPSRAWRAAEVLPPKPVVDECPDCGAAMWTVTGG